MQRITSGKRFRLPDRVVPSQVQRPMGTFDCFTLQVPPRDHFENGGQISIDRIPIPASLNCFPFIFAVGANWLSLRPLKMGWWLVHGPTMSNVVKIGLAHLVQVHAVLTKVWRGLPRNLTVAVHETHRITACFELG